MHYYYYYYKYGGSSSLLLSQSHSPVGVFTNTVGVAAASLTRDSPAFPFLRNQSRHCCRRTLTQIGRSRSCSILPLRNARSVQLRKHKSAVAIRGGFNLVLNCAATDQSLQLPVIMWGLMSSDVGLTYYGQQLAKRGSSFL